MFKPPKVSGPLEQLAGALIACAIGLRLLVVTLTQYWPQVVALTILIISVRVVWHFTRPY
jgi:hypothetical protein